MKKPELPHNEKQRLEELYSFNILDTLPEKDYDDITALASELCDTPMSLITLIDKDRQWFKSTYGIERGETKREEAFCAHAILKPEEVMIVSNTLHDDRFFDNPYVTGDPNVIFYTGVPLTSSQGIALGTLCTLDRKPRELSREQINSLKILARQVVTLMELRKSNHALLLTQKELEHRNRELEKFSYVISHDIKSPLINIMSFSGLLKEEHSEQLNDDGKKFVEFLNQSSSKLNTMVDGLLSYYRGDNLLTSATEEFDLTASISSVVNLLNVGENLQITYPLNNVILKTNKTVLEHILLNLLTNAIKYNDKNKPEIEITFKENTEHYLFSVKDNGPGIAKELHGKIFELFGSQPGKDKFGKTGTGIGLPTIKKLVEAQGGEIKISSKPENGTTFEFTIGK